MEKITTVGIDLAKSVFSLHGVDGAGRTVLRRTVRRDQLERGGGGAIALPDRGWRRAPGRTSRRGASSATGTRYG